MKTKLNFLSKLTMFFLMFATTGFSQSITNTLGTSGLFTIKDASNNYLTLSQSTGQVNILKSLRLENTMSSSSGILFKGADRFLHNFGYENIFLGVNSGNFTMAGYNNTAVGTQSFKANTDGVGNTALGWSSLSSNSTANYNTALGCASLLSTTTGYDNTAVGFSSLNTNTTGYHNSALGYSALRLNTTGINNIAMGSNCLYFNTTGTNNSALGIYSLYSNTVGGLNSALGYQSLYSNTNGEKNTSIGSLSMYANTIGDENTAIGYQSLYSNTSGVHNVTVGFSTGSSITSGQNLTCIGYNSEPTIATANNQVTLGNSSVTSLRCNVQTISSLSDQRDKKNIKDLSLGIDFLMKVKPRLFNWDKREWYDNNISDGSKMYEAPTAGFIAQELDEVQTTENAEWLNLVLKDNPEKFEATYGNLLPVMVKGIQELNTKCEKLKMENDELKNNNEKLSAEVESFKSISEKLVMLEQLVSELTLVKHTTLNTKNQNTTISKQGEEK